MDHQGTLGSDTHFPPETNERRPAIVIVDTEPESRRWLGAALGGEGYDLLEVSSTGDLAEVMARQTVTGVVVGPSFTDEATSTLLSELRASAPDTVVVVQGDGDVSTMRRWLGSGATAYVPTPTRMVDLRAQLYACLFQRHERRRERATLKAAHNSATRRMSCQLAERLALASRLRDAETGAHVERIGRYSAALSRALGFGEQEADLIGIAATAHDVGKIGIPDAILRKPGKLTPEEFEEMKRHTVIGAAILGGTDDPVLKLAGSIALSHHEKWDGTGYPNGLRGEECPVEARIVGVVDVYDALVNARVYKAAWDEERVVALFREQRGKHFEARIVDVFLESLPAMRRIHVERPDEPVAGVATA